MLEDYPREIVAKDGTPILLRPLVQEDEQRLNEFFASMEDEEIWFLRADVDDPTVLHKWMKELDFDRILPMLAVKVEDNSIVGFLRLYRRPAACMRHIAHLRIVIGRDYRHQRLGTWMLLDMIRLAMDIGIEKLVAEFVDGIEESGIAAAHKLDFFEHARLKDHVKDPRGGYHDLIIMIKNLHREWSDF
jgi:L-amino acid N-acyltransferase YncA